MNHLDGVCPACPMCDMAQPRRTPQPQTSSCEWQQRRCSRTGGWCLWCNSGDGAETTPNQFIVPLRELLSQLWAHGSDEKIRPRSTTTQKQQPCALQVFDLKNFQEEVAVLSDGLQQLLFHKFLVSYWGAKNNDSLRFNSVLVAASLRHAGSTLLWSESPEDKRRSFETEANASCINSCLHNSNLGTRWLSGLRVSNQNGSKQKSFQPRACFVTSRSKVDPRITKQPMHHGSEPAVEVVQQDPQVLVSATPSLGDAPRGALFRLFKSILRSAAWQARTGELLLGSASELPVAAWTAFR